MRITASFLNDEPLRRLLAVLNQNGEEARVVGGAVRNALLDLPPGDVDLATTERPERVMQRVAAAGLRPIPTGIEHGTVTVMVEGHSFEVTTLREDVATDGRHAVVAFGRDFVRDALRRDFTINALSCNADGEIFDYTGGLDDLQARRVRFIGDALTRIREDYLRILRFFRFHATYGEGPLDRAGFDAAIAARHGLAQLSKERIRVELLKLLATDRCLPVLRECNKAGFLNLILAGIAQPLRVAWLIARGDADALLRLGALAVQVREDAERLRHVLRLSNAETQRLAFAADVLAKLHGAERPPSPTALRRLHFAHGRQAVLDGFDLAFAESTGPVEDWARARDYLAHLTSRTVPFGGADVMAQGLSGRAVGEALQKAQGMWVDADFPEDPATLHALLQQAVATTRGGAH
ncbi:CCA tRNA nucleotidyltransferase [Methylovirgula sp. 4M-Z18]|uniref:CCA tRNA nucleotidyltransferase n=1 Tax=Methylovirgula sp. 4M-Z18 TaxID=2293567 RepID=UPI000E2EE3DB|nr:CCA tRNA nucleotidyltransferase [Methylovirgula sp. 4M-Z18]RFB79295.1 CCA tRNA nucleotidyltransferase [Methylovirgula sp. 4M-Z18]